MLLRLSSNSGSLPSEINGGILLVELLHLLVLYAEEGDYLVKEVKNDLVVLVLDLELVHLGNGLVVLLQGELLNSECVDDFVFETENLADLFQGGIEDWSLVDDAESQSESLEDVDESVLGNREDVLDVRSDVFGLVAGNLGRDLDWFAVLWEVDIVVSLSDNFSFVFFSNFAFG